MSREDFARKAAEYRRGRDRREAAVAEAFRVSSAVRGETGGKYSQPRMAILSGELSDTREGKYRVTFFAPDGPVGHSTRPTELECFKEVADTMHDGPIAPMTEAEVIAWTSSPEFERGARVTAFVQAENTLRWFAGKVGRHEWASEVIQRANDTGTRGGTVNTRGKPTDLDALDESIDVLHAAIRELPVPNPPHGFVRNPAWVTHALATHFDLLDQKVPPNWMPHLAGVTPRRNKIVADLVEFGCGAYGCVLATNDPGIVLKVTTDSTEAQFAAELSHDLVAAVCVEYPLVIRLAEKHEGATVHLLWRESAEHVGGLARQLGKRAARYVDQQHAAAQAAYIAIMDGAHDEITPLLDAWLAAVAELGQVRELAELSEGILAVWEAQRVFFGDIHIGNLGQVTRDRAKKWVITDPGNIVVIE